MVETKSKVLEILQFVINVRLDLRITNLLVKYKESFNELEHRSSAEIGGCGGSGGWDRLGEVVGVIDWGKWWV